jgi:hypothetical protein
MSFPNLDADVTTKILDYAGPNSEYPFKLVSKQTRDAYNASKVEKLQGDDKKDPEKVRQAIKTETVMGDFVTEGMPLEDGRPTSYEPADDKRVRELIRSVRADFPIGGEEGRRLDIKLMRSIVRTRSISAMRIATNMEDFFHDNGWTEVDDDQVLLMTFMNREITAVAEVAAELGDVPMMQWLVNAGYTMNAGSSDYCTSEHDVVCAAASKGHINMLDYLESCAMMNDSTVEANGEHCCAAIVNGQLGALQWLLDGPGGVRHATQSMLFDAHWHKKEEIIQYLSVEKGMVPDMSTGWWAEVDDDDEDDDDEE